MQHTEGREEAQAGKGKMFVLKLVLSCLKIWIFISSHVYQILFIHTLYNFVCQLYFDEAGGKKLTCHDHKKNLWLQVSGFCFPELVLSDSTLLPKLCLKFDLWPVRMTSLETTCLFLSRYFVWLLLDPFPRTLICPRESHTGKGCLHLLREMCLK